ncbi:hypothetical protein BH10PLA2_BH10PLA2_33210 [soil metagenome]
MSDRHLATYLADHLAGSVVALELLEHLEKTHTEADLRSFFADLRADIGSERQELEKLIRRLETSVGFVRSTVAWFAEKAGRLKLRLDDVANGSLRLLEATEFVAIGIEGKRALWQALEAASADSSKLRGTDYPTLIARSKEQRARIETVRIAAARAAFQETTAL